MAGLEKMEDHNSSSRWVFDGQISRSTGQKMVLVRLTLATVNNGSNIDMGLGCSSLSIALPGALSWD
ncbi:hypothetical protein RDI58_027013 [Solanum bulbocastanum]|uniref:Uncharacterized protein n=1 Tax=Solanum bulbocastanum TaxID=147425 RepID=A0AAN8T017_SOLBU